MLKTAAGSKMVKEFYLQSLEIIQGFNQLVKQEIDIFLSNMKENEGAVFRIRGYKVNMSQFIAILNELHFKNATSYSPLLDCPKTRNEAKIRELLNEKLCIINSLNKIFPEYFMDIQLPKPENELSLWLSRKN